MLPMIASAAVRGLWAPDEPRYAEVAREIFDSGSFLVMHLCGELYPDKPPLLYWAAGLMGWLSGWSEFFMRVPSLLATLGTAYLVAVLAKRWWGEVEAKWAPALFLTLAMVTELGGRLQIDPLLAFFCTLGIVCLSQPVGEPQQRVWWLAMGGLALGMAGLAKGPVAWINVGLVLLLWFWFAVNEKTVKPPKWAWLLMFFCALGPVLLWAVSACISEPELVEALFYDQHIGRVTKGDRHPGPIWKHLTRLPFLLLPWTLLVLSGVRDGVVDWWRRRQELDPGVARATLWILGLVVFYSAIPPKRDLYLLPAYPAAALLASHVLRRAEEGRLSRWLGAVIPLFLAAVGLALAAAGFVIPEKLPGQVWRAPAIGLPLVVGGVVAFFAYRRQGVAAWARSLVVTWVLFATVLALVVFKPMDLLKSGESLARVVAARPEKPLVIPCIGVRPEAYRFYGRLPTVPALTLDEALARDGDQFLAMVLEPTWKLMPAEIRAQTEIAHRQSVGSKDVVVLIRNRAAKSPSVSVNRYNEPKGDSDGRRQQ